MSQLVSLGSDFWNFKSIFSNKILYRCTNLDTPARKRINVRQGDSAQSQMLVGSGRLTFRGAVGTPRMLLRHVRTFTPIKFVSGHWMARCRKMHADLMCPPGKRMCFDQSRVFAGLQHSKM